MTLFCASNFRTRKDKVYLHYLKRTKVFPILPRHHYDKSSSSSCTPVPPATWAAPTYLGHATKCVPSSQPRAQPQPLTLPRITASPDRRLPSPHVAGPRDLQRQPPQLGPLLPRRRKQALPSRSRGNEKTVVDSTLDLGVSANPNPDEHQVIIEVLWRPIPTFCRGALSLSLSYCRSIPFGCSRSAAN
jgi:hypothetical protein